MIYNRGLFAHLQDSIKNLDNVMVSIGRSSKITKQCTA